jgi:hypothetical protein
VEEATRLSNSDRLPPALSNELQTITSVANELCLFLTARIELIDLYPLYLNTEHSLNLIACVELIALLGEIKNENLSGWNMKKIS